ncbi:hypothetical protein [Novosphingobium sp.]|uniref:hypothetical protein n=1 Tax=Novosphingobium sp. TaxID=1874826 RepID=UPI001ED568A9|nr:hypothetical protein [Novosphingobium sp.]MBK9011698.1 hypothetical protein [Novosphingobium sp.]
MIRSVLFTRSAIGLALALGLAAGGMAAPAAAKEKAKDKAAAGAPKITPSKAYIPAFTQARNAIDAASKRADVAAAKTAVTNAEAAYRSARGNAARTQARAGFDSAVAALGGLLQAEKATLEQAFAAGTTPDDAMLSGQLALNLGNLASDKAMQRRGLEAMIQSGKLSPVDAAKYNFYVGGLAYDLKDFAGARTAFSTAIAGGYTENGVEALLADAYINDNQVPEGLRILQQAAAKRGAAAPEDWLRRGVVVAYKARLPEQANGFSIQLVNGYPSTENWALAVSVVRDLGKFQQQEQIDLLRLMERTKSYSEARDYIEYVQSADPRRLPGEALKIINAGIAAGKLDPKDPFVTDAKTMATARIPADKASLVGLERDARAANSTAATAMAAGDAYLSYDEDAKAAEMYQLALGKPGVDAARILTRLGIAQADTGRYADAQATFARVDGVRKPIAALWSAYASSKAKAAAAAAAPAPAPAQ